MATSPTTPSAPILPGDSTEPAKYRTSCDRCKHIKVRCSKGKPACTRCNKKGVGCVYSPLRRIGRPKKADQIASVDLLRTENASVPGTIVSTPGATSLSNDHQENSNNSRRGSTRLVPVAGGISTLGKSLQRWDSEIMDSPMVHFNDHSIDVQMAKSLQPGHDSSNSNRESPRAAMDSWTLGPGISDEIYPEAISQEGNTGTYAAPQGINLRASSNALVNDQITPNTLDSMTDCYVAILTRTAKLEQSLIATLSTPPIALILEAESDVRALKHRLFTCTGHGLGDSNDSGRGCLGSDRPVLLSLALLAERVVSLLDEIFRLAPLSASTIDQAIQDSSWTSTQVSATSARRLERSFRCYLERPCVFPIPETNQDMRIGDYTIENQAKSRAVKRILQLRMRKLLRILEGMKKMPQVNERGDSSNSPLNWDGSGAVLKESAQILVEDLVRRLEALQGRISLVE